VSNGVLGKLHRLTWLQFDLLKPKAPQYAGNVTEYFMSRPVTSEQTVLLYILRIKCHNNNNKSNFIKLCRLYTTTNNGRKLLQLVN